MAQDPNVVIHFKDLETDEEVRQHLEERCLHLALEFPESTHFELTVEERNGGFQCHGRVNGKKTRVAAHCDAAENARHAGDQVLDKVERELRKAHDKRIFEPRREAQKSRGKRT